MNHSEVQIPPDRPVVYIPTTGVPATGTHADYFTIYGPLGLGWFVTLVLLALLWREFRGQRREFMDALRDQAKSHERDIERADGLRLSEQVRHEAVIREMAKEANDATVTVSAQWKGVNDALRDVISASHRRIGRREG